MQRRSNTSIPHVPTTILLLSRCCPLVEQVVKLLVGVYGAEFTVRAGNGSSPLHWAASKGKRAVIEVIAGNFCAPVCE